MSIWSLTYQQSVFKRYHSKNIYQSFTHKMAAKINWHRYGTTTTLLSPYVLNDAYQALNGWQMHGKYTARTASW